MSGEPTNEVKIGHRWFRYHDGGTTTETVLTYQQAKAWGERDERITTSE